MLMSKAIVPPVLRLIKLAGVCAIVSTAVGTGALMRVI
jgi:hypothetical protein